MPQSLESKADTFLRCPEGHHIRFAQSNYGRDYSSGQVDAMDISRRLHEPGLYCHGCNKVYGLSKLEDVQTVPAK